MRRARSSSHSHAKPAFISSFPASFGGSSPAAASCMVQQVGDAAQHTPRVHPLTAPQSTKSERRRKLGADEGKLRNVMPALTSAIADEGRARDARRWCGREPDDDAMLEARASLSSEGDRVATSRASERGRRCDAAEHEEDASCLNSSRPLSRAAKTHNGAPHFSSTAS
jgi:hypothetical protein